jgi:hypothetical protein
LRWRGIEKWETQHRSKPAAPKEHVMMFALALAIVGIAVLGSLELAAARIH